METTYDDPTLENAIQLKGITQVYRNNEGAEVKVIDNLNLLIEHKPGSKGRFVVILGESGCGKAQPLYSNIKTPGGWIAMGNIKTGDVVCTPDGGTVTVTGTFPQGLRPIYRVTFEDGRIVDCDENHLWKVYNCNWRWTHGSNGLKVVNPSRTRVLTLKEIMDYWSGSKAPLYIPLPEPVAGVRQDLPLDPYVLGLLLGDGHLQDGIHFTNVDEETLNNLRSKLLPGYELKKVIGAKCDYVIRHEHKGVINSYTAVIRELGLYGKRSWEKFVPEIYKECSVEQRLELLRGLLDTDGWANQSKKSKDGNAKRGSSLAIGTTSHALALDIQYLVRSLGGLCFIRIRKSFYRMKNGIKKRCRTSFVCYIRHSNAETLVKLSRKRERVIRLIPRILRCRIRSIKYLGMQQAKCVVVDHPDHLYITDNFIVTHNSTLLRYISGLQKPTSGEVLIFGKPRTVPIDMVFQQYSSFPWYSVLENVALPLKFKGVAKAEAEQKALQMIERVGLKGHENKRAYYPKLSGGQLQRVAIARCLVNNPQILLMDEPFGALDLHTRFQMQLSLNEIKETLNSTVVFVTHDIAEAVFLADDIYVMKANPGQIVRKFVVNAPDHRTLELRRSSLFTQQVYEIEDYFLQNLKH